MRSKGFSLIELIVVIAIIAMLARLTLPAYLEYLDRSAFGACQQELGVFKTRVLATDNLNDALEPFSFMACGVNGDGQPNQAAVAAAFRGVFDSDAASLVIDTQRDGIQAQIMANGSIERVVTP
ncbi:pilin [Vreelandella sp.]|uniref:pilin n=1 Tax=Vreelandella sp. TaxID=3137778 RepID=UPI003BADB567